jgi:hypothetical protein
MLPVGFEEITLRDIRSAMRRDGPKLSHALTDVLRSLAAGGVRFMPGDAPIGGAVARALFSYHRVCMAAYGRSAGLASVARPVLKVRGSSPN